MKYDGKNVDGIRIEGAGQSFSTHGHVEKGEKHIEPLRAIKSRRKGMAVSQKQFEDNWNKIFSK